ncbi:hypothetical protein OE564_22975 [Aeromonas hydrophila]|uniref:DUF6932 family protein n=1 Tax=Aeromonas hydrophila TaxID=644 RepID=UPI0021F3F9E8|nr:hypothetical protein [Aeromonas hydrophila]MCV9384872.1 hypothetical protein [Aeromonas hydrophila]
MNTISYRPLHPQGFLDLTLADIHGFFVAPFSGSLQRPLLAQNLVRYIQLLGAILTPHSVSFEVWIDGSFCTDKVDPNDVDILVCCSGSEFNAIPAVDQQAFIALIDNQAAKVNFSIDVYFCPNENIQNRSYWRGWFLFDRNENPKGIARVAI